MTTNNAWNSQYPAQETVGGTNQSSYAQGDILYASAANTLSKLPAGTNGQVLTSTGTVPNWEANTSTGSLILLQAQTASNDSRISFTSLIDDTYRVYFWQITQAVPENDAVTLYLNYSRDNGSSWDTDAYAYYVQRYRFNDGNMNDSFGSGEDDIYLTVEDEVSNAATEGVNLSGFMWSPTLPTSYTRTSWWGNYTEEDEDVGCDCRGAGSTRNIEDVNAISFRFSSGDIESGYFELYGVAGT